MFPGLEVSADGTVKIHGNAVEKLFVNGREIPSGEILGFLQNLPAEMIEKIQFADWWDEGSQFTGLRNTSSTSMLNLVIKDEYKRRVYGNASGGLGSNMRHHASLFGNYMDSNTVRITTMAALANTGRSDDQVDITKVPGAPGVPRRENAYVNLSYDKGGKFTLTGTLKFNNEGNYRVLKSFRSTFLPDDSIQQQGKFDELNSVSMHYGMVLIVKYKFSERTTMRTIINSAIVRKRDTSQSTDVIFGSNDSDPIFKRDLRMKRAGKVHQIGISNTLFKGFGRKDRSLLVNFNINYDDDKRLTDNSNNNQYFPNWSELNLINQFSESSDKFSAEGGFNFAEPLGHRSKLFLRY